MQLTIIKREQSYKSSLGGKHEDRKKKKKDLSNTYIKGDTHHQEVV